VKLTVTGPLGSNSTTRQVVVRPVDGVGDGIADAWRTNFFGGTGSTTNAQSCAACDPDGDGQTNWQEFHAGTVPTNSASAFRFTLISATGGSVQLSFTTVAGKFYNLEGSLTPDGSSPLILSNNIAGTGGNIAITDPGAQQQPQRFYRVRVLP
jgi:hypothetical protein